MQHYIFKYSALDIFSNKLINFHETCVDGLVTTGIGSNTDKLIDINFHPGLDLLKDYHPGQTYKEVLEGIYNSKPLFHIICEEETGWPHTECYIMYLTDNVSIEDYYMVQTIYNYPVVNKSLVQVWRLQLLIPLYIDTQWRS